MSASKRQAKTIVTRQLVSQFISLLASSTATKAQLLVLVPSPAHLDGQAMTESISGNQSTALSYSPNPSLLLTHRIPQNKQSGSSSRVEMPLNEHVLFGINRGYELRLVQIDKSKHPEDGKFFAQLKQQLKVAPV